VSIKHWNDISEKDLESLSKEIKSLVDKPSIIFLEGPVGAGKTTFTRHFIGEIGVQSPTYSIVGEFEEYAHADFYRIKTPADIMHLELSLYLEEKDYFLIEWGLPYIKEVERELNEDFSFYKLEIDANDSTSRRFSLSKL
jgi:tRNA threonylcarbamoyladenosine biosynthesis protein TsaE